MARVAVLSDLHGNLAALEAVIDELEHAGLDLVVHGGDLALSGAHPAEVVDRVRELGWPGVVGNVDELLWRPEQRETREAEAPNRRPLFGLLFGSHAEATREMLGTERIGLLRQLPREHRIGELVVLHASPGDLWRAPLARASEDELMETYSGLGAALVVYGHIHRPYVRALPDLTVANSGSIGQPWDGDPRASYLLIEDGEVTIRRVEYDIEREATALAERRYPNADWLAERLRLGRFLPVPER
jgi:putative phosphoesterase